MHLDVITLRDFYYRQALGRRVQKVLRGHLAKLWPDARGQCVVGYGFATPVLRPYFESARRVIALMPAPQGVMRWPNQEPNVSVLCDEHTWPLPTGFVDKLVVMHGLETTAAPVDLLAEIWRILGPGGKVVFIVPNRGGLWARSDRTPYGFGRPYSAGQLEAQLQANGFDPLSTVSTLYQPPSASAFWRRFADWSERVGQNTPVITGGGVLIVEAQKQASRPKPRGLAITDHAPLTVLEGISVRPAPTTKTPAS